MYQTKYQNVRLLICRVSLVLNEYALIMLYNKLFHKLFRGMSESIEMNNEEYIIR